MKNIESQFSDDVIKVSLKSNDFDWSHYLNNSVYPELFETGRWSWGKTNNLDLTHSRYVAVVVRMEIDYLVPVEWNPLEEVNVLTDLDKINEYSFYLNQSVLGLNGTLHAKGYLRLALYDLDQKRPVSISTLIKPKENL